jgi:hypothetical protein
LVVYAACTYIGELQAAAVAPAHLRDDDLLPGERYAHILILLPYPLILLPYPPAPRAFQPGVPVPVPEGQSLALYHGGVSRGHPM